MLTSVVLMVQLCSTHECKSQQRMQKTVGVCWLGFQTAGNIVGSKQTELRPVVLRIHTDKISLQETEPEKKLNITYICSCKPQHFHTFIHGKPFSVSFSWVQQCHGLPINTNGLLLLTGQWFTRSHQLLL